MWKRMGAVCLTGVLALIMTVIASPSYGTNASRSYVDVKIKVKDKGNTTCEIELKEKKEQRFKGVCKDQVDDEKCDGNTLRWDVEDKCTNLTWQLVITNVDGYPGCFPLSNSPKPMTVAVFTKAGTLSVEVTPLDGVCTYNPKGVYWPYVITLYDNSGTEADKVDPGGIIFP